jgi:hypothetical protein
VGYIAVYGSTAATFSLLVSGMFDEAPVTLQDGHRLYGRELTIAGSYAYYRVLIDGVSTSLRCT